MNELNIISTKEKMKVQTYVCTAQPFDLGKVVITQGIDALLRENIGASLRVCLMRHQNGDWGNMPIEDKISNDEATKTGERILSGYRLCDKQIWIITEWDRSVTTVLLPNEY
ncbi:Type I restriction endonuclease subunit M [Vibrio crassostreae]|nr:type I restriction endonuclease subunit M [Vibrio lentus]CAK3883508.1 Type I restriction endonuclease subunit M [Vibrio crassostreae]